LIGYITGANEYDNAMMSQLNGNAFIDYSINKDKKFCHPGKSLAV
jgi:hypothetical protein